MLSTLNVIEVYLSVIWMYIAHISASNIEKNMYL